MLRPFQIATDLGETIGTRERTPKLKPNQQPFLQVFNTATIDDFLYYGDTIKIVELPYSDHHFSMFIFMPGQSKSSCN